MPRLTDRALSGSDILVRAAFQVLLFIPIYGDSDPGLGVLLVVTFFPFRLTFLCSNLLI